MSKNYNSNSYTTFKEEETVRNRPSTVFGSATEVGAVHSIFELFVNGIDEVRAGFADKVRLTCMEDGSVEIEDNGRGIPMDWSEKDQKFGWQLAFCTLYSTGKADDLAYDKSLGLNGIGLTATQYASEYMEAYSTYDGKTRYMRFEKGKPIGEMQVLPARCEHGTFIRFKPDKEVFMGVGNHPIDKEYFVNRVIEQAMLHPKATVTLEHPALSEPYVLNYPNGPVDVIDIICSKPLLKETIVNTGEETGCDDPEKDPVPYTVNMYLALNFTRSEEVEACAEVFHNASRMSDGGVTMAALQYGLTSAFEAEAKERGKISKSEKFSYNDIAQMMYCIVSTECPGYRTMFKHQTKTAIENPFIKQKYMQFVYDTIRNWARINKEDSDKVIQEIILNKEMREKTENISKKLIKSLSTGNTLNQPIPKFTDCETKDPALAELYIVEGDSASGSVLTSRDSFFQAVIGTRGKGINALKEHITRVLSNDIVINIFRALGCGIDVQSKDLNNLPKFDISKLRYHKIIICTDADTDGMQIRCLLLTMFYVLAPELLKQGYVYIALTPLYTITAGTGKNEQVRFAYEEYEKQPMIDELLSLGFSANKIKVARSKGLGENEAEMMSESTMDPATRRLVPVDYPESDEEVATVFNTLLGTDIEARRIIIDQYFRETKGELVTL